MDVRDSESNWAPFALTAAAESASNVLLVLYDDTGLGDWFPFGSKINMPTVDELAEQGLTYTKRRAIALYSPTRSSILTGRIHYLNGMVAITDTVDSFPGASGRFPPQMTTIAEVLRANG
ncbi:sulfatase-like hydrolase/transferase [Ruegeria conchae]|uniref:sulfatase-like hydrolase/transferase n=1 Tax=Ruegeria conchae TaxID=981384 RepID=UPI002D1E498C|nr:sulfatase-like hydrolase/transferase [Ruegeria conchae]